MVLNPTPVNETLINPIVDSGADPWIILWNGSYYYCRVSEGAAFNAAWKKGTGMTWTQAIEYALG